MRTLKKTLAFVLVLCMTVGLLSVGAGAISYKDFSDADDINFTEAVDVMTNLGIILGYDDGTFLPQGKVTREEAAKIVSYIMLGKTVADNLKASTAPFTDVAATRWSAGYIAYCANEGIINGMGDGTFAPADNVTGYQFAKMLLCALGLGQADEYVGTSWAINTAKDALSNNLFADNLSADFNAAVTREEAVLYAFNALKANTYTAQYQYDMGNKYVTSYSKDATTLGYQKYNLDKLNASKFGQTGYYWVTAGNTKVSEFYTNDKVIATSYAGYKVSALTDTSSNNYLASKATAVKYYVNGVEQTVITDGTQSVRKGQKFVYNNTLYVAAADEDTAANQAVASNEYAPAIGTVIELIDTFNSTTKSYDGKVDKVAITEVSIATLTASKPVTTTTSGTVTKVSISACGISGVDSRYVSGYEDLAKDDVVKYYSVFNSDDGRTYYYIEKCEYITGTMTAYNSTAKTVTIDGTVYKVSGLNGAAYASNFNNLIASNIVGVDGVKYYLDDGGNIVKAVSGVVGTDLSRYLFVKNSAPSGALSTTYVAAVVYMDGTTETVTIAKTAKDNGAMKKVTGNGTGNMVDGYLKNNIFYTYTENSDGSLNLRAVNAINQAAKLTDLGGNGISEGDTSYVIKKNVADFLYKATATAADWENPSVSTTGEGILGTNSTAFLYYNSAVQKYSVYTGIRNVPGYAAGGDIYVLLNPNNNAYALAVIASGSSTTATLTGYDSVYIVSDPTYNYTADGGYYTYKAIVNGDIVPDYAVTGDFGTLAKGRAYLVTGYTSDNKADVIWAYNDDDHSAYDNIVAYHENIVADSLAYNGGILTDSVGSYVLADDVKIFVYDTTVTPAVTQEITGDGIENLAITGNDDVTLVKTSATNDTIAYVYICLQ